MHCHPRNAAHLTIEKDCVNIAHFNLSMLSLFSDRLKMQMNDNNDYWKSFITLCEQAVKEDKLSLLLEFLLTPEEKKAIPTRYIIVEDLLKETCSQRDIAEKRHVSIAKITRGSNELKRMNENLKAFLKAHTL